MSKVIFESEKRITQHYGVNGHGGVDLGHRGGSADDVYANCTGRVTYIQRGYVQNINAEGMASYGNLVIVTHENNYKSYYAHLSEIYVNLGDEVNSLTKLGHEGATGCADAVHCHFEVRDELGRRINPEPFLTKRIGDVGKKEVPNAQEKHNADILELVKKTIRGDFGNGYERKNILGENYNEVQRQVNLNYANGTTRWDNIKLY